jgi:hypothetical protein
MSLNRWIAILIAAFSLVGIGSAQKNELSGLIGRTFIPTQSINGATWPNPNLHFGDGLTFEGNYARRFHGEGFLELRFEVPFAYNIKEKLNTGANLIPESYSSVFVAPSVRVNVMADSILSPWASIGGGYGRFFASDKLLYGGTNPGNSSNTGLMQLGVGLDVKVSGPWGIRLAARDFWTGRPPVNVDTSRDRQHNFFVGGGVTYKF